MAVETRSNPATTDLQALHDMERKIDVLPMLPQVLLKLLQLKPTDENYFDRFEELIEQDPAFAVKVIAHANSASSAPVDPISTIKSALTRLGTEGISGLVTSLSVQRVFFPKAPNQVRLWQHSISVAVATQNIAKRFRVLQVDSGEAYLIGLLHDVGRFVMLEHSDHDLQKVDERHWLSPEALIEADVEIFKFTHSELGYLACRHWGLPDSVAQVIRHHHSLLGEPIETGSADAVNLCVQVADRLAMYLIDDPSAERSSPDEVREIIETKCLVSAQARHLLSVARLADSLGEIKSESRRLFSGLGFEG